METPCNERFGATIPRTLSIPCVCIFKTRKS